MLSHLANAHNLILNGQDDNNIAFINSAISNMQARINASTCLISSQQQSSPCNFFSNTSPNIENLKLTTTSNNLPEMLSIELKKRLQTSIFDLKDGGPNDDNGCQLLHLGNGSDLLRFEQILGQLDSRVCRLEKQLEMALNR